jgi:hypothetical protein
MEVPLNIFRLFVLGARKWLAVVVLYRQADVSNLGCGDGLDGASCICDGGWILHGRYPSKVWSEMPALLTTKSVFPDGSPIYADVQFKFDFNMYNKRG